MSRKQKPGQLLHLPLIKRNLIKDTSLSSNDSSTPIDNQVNLESEKNSTRFGLTITTPKYINKARSPPIITSSKDISIDEHNYEKDKVKIESGE